MSSSRDGLMSSTQVQDLLAKLRNPDMDFRYMALNDLLTELQKSSVIYEDSMASRVTEAVLKTLEDKNGEVQNMAIKCLGPLVRRCKDNQIKLVVDRLCKTNTNDELKDISATALRTVIMGVPANSSVAASVTKQLMPQLLTQLRDDISQSDALLDRLDVLIALLDKFHVAVNALVVDDKKSLLQALMTLLDNARSAVRKRAVIALGTLTLSLPEAQFSNFMSELLEMLAVTKTNDKLKTLISLEGQICKAETLAGASRFGDYLQSMILPVIDSLQLEDDELREIALQTLEAFVTQGNVQIRRYESQMVDAVVQFLRYDPNYDEDVDEDDEEMTEANGDDDSDLGSEFDDDAEYDDDDDISWKLRRSAARLAAAMLLVDVNSGGNSFHRIVPVLVSRMYEREDTVRIEVFETLAIALQQCRVPIKSPISRKRLRDEGAMDTESTPPPQDLILSLCGKIIKSSIKQLAGKNLVVRQLCFRVFEGLLRIDAVSIVPSMSQILPCARTALAHSQSGGNALTTSALKITTLEFLDSLLTLTPSTALGPHMNDIVDLVATTIVHEKINKVTLVCLIAARHLLAVSSSLGDQINFSKTAEMLFNELAANDVEQEIRDELVSSLSSCIWQGAPDVSRQACQILASKVEQESTRLMAINAIGKSVTPTSPLPKDWLIQMTRELLKYINNANRALRIAAVLTSTLLVTASGSQLTDTDVQQIAQSVVTTLSSEDTQLIVAGLQWLSVFSQNVRQKALVQQGTLSAVLMLLQSSLVQQSGPPTTNLVAYFSAIAQGADSTKLLHTLYEKADEAANLSLLAKLIASILLNESGTSSWSASVQKIKAPKTAENRRALEIYVLGEVGCLQALSADEADLILAQLNSPSDKVKGAASVALGNIASNDPAVYSPRLLDEIAKAKDDRYLLAASLKEMIITAESGPRVNALADKADQISSTLLTLNFSDRATGIVAESIGRLTQLRPHQLLPRLRAEVKSDSATSRALVIRAVRYTFSTSSSAFDEQLRPFIVDFLSLMEDSDLEIRRLALSTLYSAAHSKPHLIADHLLTLLPLLYRETVVKKELVHTIQMGPFKHIVDDGLELRKSAFETLYSLLDTFYTSMDISNVFEVILRGLDDAHEIKILSCLMIVQLAVVSASETRSRIDYITEKLQKHMMTKLKDHAVKQDREKDNEIKRAILRCALSLQPLANDASPGYNSFMAEMQATRAPELDELKSMMHTTINKVPTTMHPNGAGNHDQMEM